MLPQTKISLSDLLSAAPQQGGLFPFAQPADNAADNEQPVFSDLLRELSLPGDITSLLGFADTQLPQTNDSRISNAILPEHLSDIKTNIDLTLPNATASIPEDLGTTDPDTKPVDLPGNEKNNIIAFNSALRALDNKLAQTAVSRQIDLSHMKSIELPEGNYKVVDIQVQPKNATLSIISETGEQLQVTLPKEQLLSLSNGNRVSLLSQAEQLQQLDKYVEQLKITDIQITRNEQTARVNLTVTADKNNGIQQLTAVIPQNQVKTINLKQFQKDIELNPDVESVDVDMDTDALSTEPLKGAARSERASVVTAGKAAVLDQSKTWQQSWLSSQHKIGNTGQKSTPETGELFDSVDLTNSVERLTTLGGSQKMTTQTAPIKFTLPEDLQTVLKPNGQSILLQIEPEHLGPAKLSLSMSNDKLKARLVVNSTLAKSMVEGSLHRLVDQLAKVDIKVDLIDIHVSGDAAGNELLNRQTQYPRKMTHRMLGTDDSFTFESQTVEPSAMPRSQYLSSSGVNVLA